MATFNIYHGAPDFNPGALLADVLLNGTFSGSDPSNAVFTAPDGVAIDFTGSFSSGGLLPVGTVTGFEVAYAGGPMTVPLITATGYHFDFSTGLFPAILAYHLGNPLLFNALLNVPTTYNGSPDNDFIVDITTLGSRLYGSAGNDTLIGGSGRDFLYGGRAPTTSTSRSVSDSVVGPHRDIVEDFSHAEGDKIGLALIDANTRVAGNQAFGYIGSDTFAHYHALHHAVYGMVRFSGGIVQGNVNDNLAPDFEIALNGVAGLSCARLSSL